MAGIEKVEKPLVKGRPAARLSAAAAQQKRGTQQAEMEGGLRSHLNKAIPDIKQCEDQIAQPFFLFILPEKEETERPEHVHGRDERNSLDPAKRNERQPDHPG